jgi:hypothetical protein
MLGQRGTDPLYNHSHPDKNHGQGRAAPGPTPATLARRAHRVQHHRQALERHRPPPRRPGFRPSSEVPHHEDQPSTPTSTAAAAAAGCPTSRGWYPPHASPHATGNRPPPGDPTRPSPPVPPGLQPRARHLLRRPADLPDRPTPARLSRPAHLQTRHGPLRRRTTHRPPTLSLLLLNTPTPSPTENATLSKRRLTRPRWSVLSKIVPRLPHARREDP